MREERRWIERGREMVGGGGGVGWGGGGGSERERERGERGVKKKQISLKETEKGNEILIKNQIE